MFMDMIEKGKTKWQCMSTQICAKIYKNKTCQKTINATPNNFSNSNNNLHAHVLKKMEFQELFQDTCIAM